MNWGRSDSFVVVSVVQEHPSISQQNSKRLLWTHYLRSEVTNNVDNKENSALGRLHRQVTTSSVALDWVSSRSFDKKVENGFG